MVWEGYWRAEANSPNLNSCNLLLPIKRIFCDTSCCTQNGKMTSYSVSLHPFPSKKKMSWDEKIGIHSAYSARKRGRDSIAYAVISSLSLKLLGDGSVIFLTAPIRQWYTTDTWSFDLETPKAICIGSKETW